MDKIKSIYKEFTSFEGSLFTYSLSFSLLLALAPSLLIFALLFKYSYLSEDLILNFLLNFLPDSDSGTINQLFAFFADKNYSIISFIVTMCTSFYLASRSVFSFLLISASHESVDIPKWTIRIKAVLLFVALAILLMVTVFVVTTWLDFLPLISAVAMLFLFYMMYRALSFRKRNWTFGLAGAMFTTVCIMGLAALFVSIVRAFTSYNDVYGPLASLVTLLLAIYLISCIIYLGFCLNIVYEEDYIHEEDLPLKNEKTLRFLIQVTDNIKRKFRKNRG